MHPAGYFLLPGRIKLVSSMDLLDQKLLNDFQHDLPLSTTPYADIAEQLGIDEHEVLERLAALQQQGMVSRVGPVFQTDRIGASSLVAIAVPQQCLEEVAKLINSYSQVNHNYEREHHYNLWFVVTASSQEHLRQLLQDIEQRTGLSLLILPMLQAYHIDLGFRLQWQ